MFGFVKRGIKSVLRPFTRKFKKIVDESLWALYSEVNRSLVQNVINESNTIFLKKECFDLFCKVVERIPKADRPLLSSHTAAVFLCLCRDGYPPTQPKSVIDLFTTLRFLNDFPGELGQIRDAGRRKPPVSSGAVGGSEPCAPFSGTQVRDSGMPTPLNVLFVTYNFPGVDNGGGLRIFDIMQELSARGHRVYLYTTYHEPIDAKSMKLLGGFLAGIRVVKPPEFSTDDLDRWLDGLSVPFDAAHCVWPMAGTIIPKGWKRAKKSVFEFIESTPRRSVFDIEVRLGENNWQEVGRFARELLENLEIEKKSVANVDETIAMVERDADFAVAMFDIVPPELVPTCVSRFAVWDRIEACSEPRGNGVEKAASTAFFIGNYSHYPNVDALNWFLGKVHPQILERLPKFKFVVAGKGDITAIEGRYRDDPSVIFLGELPDIIPPILRSQICVAPLITGAGIRGKINQYAAAGRPVVSTSVGNCGLPYTDGESIMIADTPKDFADAVVRLLVDGELYQKIAGNALVLCRANFAWEAQIRKLEELYAR